jgi:hypothetical protein
MEAGEQEGWRILLIYRSAGRPPRLGSLQHSRRHWLVLKCHVCLGPEMVVTESSVGDRGLRNWSLKGMMPLSDRHVEDNFIYCTEHSEDVVRTDCGFRLADFAAAKWSEASFVRPTADSGSRRFILKSVEDTNFYTATLTVRRTWCGNANLRWFSPLIALACSHLR